MSQAKKLSLKPGVKPTVPEDADSWIETRSGKKEERRDALGSQTSEKTKRITFEVTQAQHQAIKIRATQKGMSIKELMVALLERELQDG